VTNPAVVGATAAGALAELAVARQRAGAARAGTGERPRRRRRIAHRIVSAALAAGLTGYVLGRTGGPLCRPDSLLQPHALWHVLTAVAMAAWGADRLPTASPTRCGNSRVGARRPNR